MCFTWGDFIKREGDVFFSSFLHPNAWSMDEMAGALAAFRSMRMRAKPNRWQRNTRGSLTISWNFHTSLRIAYFQPSVKRKITIVFKPLSFEYILLYAVNPNSNGKTTGWSPMSPALLSPCFRSCHLLDRDYVPSCLYLLKPCPSFEGWMKFHLPHETSLPLPPLNCRPPLLGHLAETALTLIIPLHLSPHSSKIRIIQGKVRIARPLYSRGPRGSQYKVTMNMPLVSVFHLYLQPRSRRSQKVRQYILKMGRQAELKAVCKKSKTTSNIKRQFGRRI